jgi:hypothetical protein
MGEGDNQDIVVLPPELFIKATQTKTFKNPIMRALLEVQEQYKLTIKGWCNSHRCYKDDEEPILWAMDLGQWITPPDNQLKQLIMIEFHDAPTAGHPGIEETIRQVKANFWWPRMSKWIEDYVKGCAVCQQNKNIMH